MEGMAEGVSMQTMEDGLESGELGSHRTFKEEALANRGADGDHVQSIEAKDEVASVEQPKKTPKPKDPLVPFVKLFSFADRYDYLLMFFGTIGALAHGAALPAVFLFFGSLLNGLGSFDKNHLTRQVNRVRLFRRI
jgi:hypothetical protein